MSRKPILFLTVAVILFTACGDIEEAPVLEELKIVPAEYSETLNAKPKQFYAVGYYSDDSTTDLTDEATWAASDSTGDSLLSSSIPGMVFFVKIGWFAISAKYIDVSSDEPFSATALVQITN